MRPNLNQLEDRALWYKVHSCAKKKEFNLAHGVGFSLTTLIIVFIYCEVISVFWMRLLHLTIYLLTCKIFVIQEASFPKAICIHISYECGRRIMNFAGSKMFFTIAYTCASDFTNGGAWLFYTAVTWNGKIIKNYHEASCLKISFFCHQIHRTVSWKMTREVW